MKTLEVHSQSKEEFIDITKKAKDFVDSSGVRNGLCLIYVPHTTAAVTINENADPSVKRDIISTLKKIVPDSLPYSHLEGNSPAHIKASLVGPSTNIIIENGELALGTWQGIFFCEFDGPRKRKVYMRALSV
jgi:secondary thiamine-phosphate synthase enzyme